MKKDEKLNWQQACALMGCSRSHFYNLVNSGMLMAQRYGKIKGVRVLRSDCVKYMKNKEVLETVVV